MVIQIKEDSKLLAGINEECLFSNDNMNWVKLFFVGVCSKTGRPVGASFIESGLYSSYIHVKELWDKK